MIVMDWLDQQLMEGVARPYVRAATILQVCLAHPICGRMLRQGAADPMAQAVTAWVWAYVQAEPDGADTVAALLAWLAQEWQIQIGMEIT